VLDAGADSTVDLSAANLRDSLRDQVRAATNDGGVDVIVDTIGGDAFEAALRALNWCGRCVVVGFASGSIPTVRANYLLVKNIEVSGLQISDYRKRRPDLVRACFSEIFALFEAGRIRLGAAETFPFEKVTDALGRVRDRRAKGRVVLSPSA
jgi:NADPH2:quinone reductase